MEEIWESIATVGSALTAIGLIPIMVILIFTLSTEGMQGVDAPMVSQMLISIIKVLAPTTAGGALLFVLFQYAEEQT